MTLSSSVLPLAPNGSSNPGGGGSSSGLTTQFLQGSGPAAAPDAQEEGQPLPRGPGRKSSKRLSGKPTPATVEMKPQIGSRKG